MRKRVGFTLLELLVVVAIIAMLVALLLPALLAAREKAYQAKCLTNQRDIAMSIHMWLQDHEETYPTTDQVWEGVQLPPEKLLCPTMQNALLRGSRRNPDAPRPNDYAYSSFVAGEQASKVKNPCTEMLTADAMSGSALSPNGPPPTYNIFSTPTDIDFRHSGAFIAGYCDGHVALSRELPPYWLVNLANLTELDTEVLHYNTAPVLFCYTGGLDLILAPRGGKQDVGWYFYFVSDFLYHDLPIMFRGRLKIVIRGGQNSTIATDATTGVSSVDASAISDRLGLDITRLPCVVFFRNGKEIQRFLGPPPDMDHNSLTCVKYNRAMMQSVIDEARSLVGPASADQ